MTQELDIAPGGTFTVVALPDMQSYAYRSTDVYRRVTRWIVENRRRQRIVFVSHLGDAVDQPGARDQWQVAREAMGELDGVVPYGVALGNHDFLPGWKSLFDDYFPSSPVADQLCDGGFFEHSSFHLLGVEGCELLFLQLECNGRDQVLDWANRVIADHPGRMVVVSTHCYLGRLTKGLPREERWYTPRGRVEWSRFADGNSARQMWDKCFKHHRNIFMVLSGDQAYVQALRRVSFGRHGNLVHEMVSDYSYASRDLIGAHSDFFIECGLVPDDLLREADYRSVVLARPEFGRPRSGTMAEIKQKSGKPQPATEGYIRLLRFIPSRNCIEVKTFSPVTGKLCRGNPVVPDPAQHVFSLKWQA